MECAKWGNPAFKNRREYMVRGPQTWWDKAKIILKENKLCWRKLKESKFKAITKDSLSSHIVDNPQNQSSTTTTNYHPKFIQVSVLKGH